MEKADDNDSADKDEGEDEDEDRGHGSNRTDTVRVAKKIYKKALKVLKFKLYFENIFPTDVEKDSLAYSCWTSAVVSTGQIDGGSAAARKMFHDFGYEDTVRTFASCSVF